MFTFQAENNPMQQKLKNKISPVPDITEPERLFPLPPLHFSIEASQPLTELAAMPPQGSSQIAKYKRQCEEQAEKYHLDMQQLNQKMSTLYDQYIRQKREHEILKQKYRQGEALFIQLESQNHHLRLQLQAVRAKKIEKNRNSLAKPKQVPIVKINVPNPKQLGAESEKDTLLKQIKIASDEISHLKERIEQEKKRSEERQKHLNRQFEEVTAERDQKRREVHNLSEEVRLYRQKTLNHSSQSDFLSHSKVSIFDYQQQHGQFQKIKEELERIKRIHKTCDVLISSKNTEIEGLQCEINHLKQRSIFVPRTEPTAKRQIFQESSSSPFNVQPNTSVFESPSYLEQHLELSIKEMKSLQSYIKPLIQDFIEKIQQLRGQLEWSRKKSQNQQFELDRVYQLLRHKKAELENCYKDLTSGKKNNRTLGMEEDDQHLKSLLKNRRDIS